MTARHRFDWRVMYLLGRMRRQQQHRVMVRLRCIGIGMRGVW